MRIIYLGHKERFKHRNSGRVHSKSMSTAKVRIGGHHYSRLLQNASHPHLPTCLFYHMRENDRGDMRMGLRVLN